MNQQNQQSTDLISLAELAKNTKIPVTTLSSFTRREMFTTYTSDKDKRLKLVSISEVNDFLQTPKAGPHQGKAYAPGNKDMAPARNVDDSASAISGLQIKQSGAADALQPCQSQGSPESAQVVSPTSKGESVKRRPGNLKRFKREARRLRLSEVEWGLRYLFSRRDHLHDHETMRLQNESRSRKQAIVQDDALIRNAGNVPAK